MLNLLRTVLPLPVKQALKDAISLTRSATGFAGARQRPRELAPAADAEAIRIAGRKRFAMSYFDKQLALIESWAPMHTEDTNFYYDLTDLNRLHLAHLLSHLTSTPLPRVIGVFEELENDEALRRHLQTGVFRIASGRDISVAYGRRLGWYALARILKPSTIIETGVEHGVGSCVLSSALLRNAAEGHPGRYYGTDIRETAGELYTAPYSSAGEILYGDSLQSLAKFDQQIDLFVNDSDHSADYEYREYEMIYNKLSQSGVILGDNSHVTDSLPRFCAKTARPFVFFRETPSKHWYPGAGIGISFPGPQ